MRALTGLFGANAASDFLPYLTDPDPDLARAGSGRDPLGLQPVWSGFGRKLVPYIASPVRKVSGIKAVLLIHWLSNTGPIRKLLPGAREERGFFRLMEGLIEYWLHSTRKDECFGSRSLVAANEKFSVTVDTGKTVANGLHQYYRGTCRRAGLLEDDWNVQVDLRQSFVRLWSDAATQALAATIRTCLRGQPLVPARVLLDEAISGSLRQVFDSQDLDGILRRTLFGGDIYRDLACRYSLLRARDKAVAFGENHVELAYPRLDEELGWMRRCEPYLVMLQDVFDLMRADGASSVSSFATKLVPYASAIRERAREFSALDGQLDSNRLRQLQTLASSLTASQGDSDVECLSRFVKQLVQHHEASMDERGRDPFVLLEGENLVQSAPGERDAEDAQRRLREGYPWMNDYYLGAAADLYEQLYGEAT